MRRSLWNFAEHSPMSGLGAVGYNYPRKGNRYYSHFTDLMTEVQLTVFEVEVQTQVCMKPKACTFFSPTLSSL